MSTASIDLQQQKIELSIPKTLVSELPWSSSAAENKRFNRIIAVTLLVTVMFAALVKWQELPERARAEKEKIPPQLTRLMTPKKVEIVKPKPQPKPIEAKPEPKVAKPKPKAPKPVEPKKVQPKKVTKQPPKPVKVKVPTQQELTQAAKIKAKQSGLLAFQDDLASMRDNASLQNLANTQTIKGTGASEQTQRKFIGRKTSEGSGGVNTSTLTTDSGSRGELAGRKNTEYVAPTEGLASIASKQLETEDTVIGSRDTESIRKILDGNKGAIYAIYRKALRADPSLQGKLTVSLQIEPDGSVSRVTLVFSELASPQVEQKLLRRIGLINFGNQQVSQTKLEYSFNFLPF